ncbi:MAG: formylglycine-generating enzyme family protein [Bdellovibrionia bacterium]
MTSLSLKFPLLLGHVRLFSVLILILASISALALPNAAFAVLDSTSTQSSAQSDQDTRPEGTQGFTAYLGSLLEQQIIGDDELILLIEAFEKGRVINPIPHLTTPFGVAFTRSNHQVHFEGLQGYLNRTRLDPQALLSWAESHLKEAGCVRERRERARVATLEIFQKMEFNRVEGPLPFELMSTQVTQKNWSMIMGNNPSKFLYGDRTIVMNLAGNSVFMQPDNPVEQVSWLDTQAFIDKLNELSRQDDPLLYELIVDHHPGDRFQLPTEVQWLSVASNHGTATGKYFFGDNEAELVNYAWYIDNSHGTTHPVAELQPFIVDGKAFYDILGNVWEWMEDSREEIEEMEIPQSYSICLEKFRRVKKRIEHVLKGGRWAASAMGLKTSFPMTSLPSVRSDGNGLRLVRVRAAQK